jgi:ribosomal-protein-alanine N-acetyltransferase
MMSAPCIVRRALPSDLAAILAVEQASTEAPHWGETVWRALLITNAEDYPTRASFVAEGSIGPLGFVVVSCASGIAELESVAVAVSERRQGIARALCAEAMAWSQNKRAQAIELEVRASSIGARALYSSLGFTQCGTRRGYYRDPTEDAVLMSAPL